MERQIIAERRPVGLGTDKNVGTRFNRDISVQGTEGDLDDLRRSPGAGEDQTGAAVTTKGARRTILRPIARERFLAFYPAEM